MAENTVTAPAETVPTVQVEKPNLKARIASKVDAHPRIAKFAAFTAVIGATIVGTSVVKNMQAQKEELALARENVSEAVDHVSTSMSTPDSEA